MKRLRRIAAALACTTMLVSGCGPNSRGSNHDRTSKHNISVTTNDPKDDEVAGNTAATPKPIADPVKKGLAWLASHQLKSGGWGQGDESVNMGHGMDQMRDTASVADTSMAVLAFIRAGNTPRRGDYQEAVRRGIDYMLSEIEEADTDSLYVTDVRGTRVQGKIGTYVDTFTALMVLTEAKGSMADAAGNRRLDAAIAKVLHKVEKNQAANGGWANAGWAPVLTQSIAAKGLNRASQAGIAVNEKVLEAVEKNAQGDFNGRGFGSSGAAGVDLYAQAAGSSTLQDSVTTRRDKKEKWQREAKAAPTPEARAEASRQLVATDEAEKVNAQAQGAVIAKLDDQAFLQGFGNNGGEEFLSYMLMSESLVAKGGEDWIKWDQSITKLVNAVQNGDGSWTGHHCITGRTFCTAAALLVLLADRAPISAQVAS